MWVEPDVYTTDANLPIFVTSRTGKRPPKSHVRPFNEASDSPFTSLPAGQRGSTHGSVQASSNTHHTVTKLPQVVSNTRRRANDVTQEAINTRKNTNQLSTKSINAAQDFIGKEQHTRNSVHGTSSQQVASNARTAAQELTQGQQLFEKVLPSVVVRNGQATGLPVVEVRSTNRFQAMQASSDTHDAATKLPQVVLNTRRSANDVTQEAFKTRKSTNHLSSKSMHAAQYFIGAEQHTRHDTSSRQVASKARSGAQELTQGQHLLEEVLPSVVVRNAQATDLPVVVVRQHPRVRHLRRR
ncbi:hypothetical protein DPMN_154795 [Dreissena polymorpha]|uniref:Uncharacterized protein n=1 Tax=Dreissena polymorpha TaxID=45954 RepID=A0A9D4FP69_DREPO|nr:hypothetical protein DPMN_154795 [Dreissena polymorpha]